MKIIHKNTFFTGNKILALGSCIDERKLINHTIEIKYKIIVICFTITTLNRQRKKKKKDKHNKYCRQ